MYKFSSPSDYNFDIEPTSIIREKKHLEKRASARELMRWEPTPKHTDLHVIALGSGEYTGQNRNGDIFTEDDCVHKHGTFVESGRVHRNHKNKKTDPVYGIIKASAYNQKMGRIELILGLDNNKCADILDEQEKKGQTNWSMGCTLDPNYPVLTSEGYKPISEIAVGDLVYTHNRNWKKVKSLKHSLYTGETVKLRLNGLPEFPEVTSDHLFLAVKFGKNKQKQFRYFRDNEFEKSKPSWLHVNHLEVGDRLFYNNISNFPATASFEDLNLVRLMGYYTAEGNVDINSVHFHCNINDSLPRVLPKICAEIFPNVTVNITKHKKSELGLTVSVYNVNIAQFMSLYCKKLAHKKTICPELFGSSEEVKLAFLGAWMDGDGFCDKKGMHFSSCNFNLLLQGRDLLGTMGIGSSIYKIDHSNCETSGNFGQTVEYTLNISWLDGSKFFAYSQKVKDCPYYQKETENRRMPTCLRELSDGLFAYRIKSVNTRFVKKAPVYNFEVEDDESYTLGGVISHNCSVHGDTCTYCSRFAEDDKRRCEHIPAKLGEINKQGVQCAMKNKVKRWFELSHVKRPADRIGMSLKKLSSELPQIKTSSQLVLAEYKDNLDLPEDTILISKKASAKRNILTKLSEMEKKVDAMASNVSDNIVKKQVGVEKTKEGLSKDTLEELRKVEPAKLFKELADNGITLSLCDFVKYLFEDKVPKDRVEGAKTHLPDVFQNISDEEVNEEKFEPSFSTLIPKELKSIIGSLFSEHSLFDKPANGRVMRIIIMKKIPTAPKKEEKTKEAFDRLLAKTYASYKLAALNYMDEKNTLTDDVMKNAIIQNIV